MLPAPRSTRSPLAARMALAVGVALAMVAAIGAALVGAKVLRPGSALTSADSAVAEPSATAPDAGLTSSTSPIVSAAPPTTPPARVQTTPPPAAPKPTGSAAFETAVLALVNSERAKAGCNALTADARLTKAARGHSQDMAARDYFSHDTPEGVGFATRITNAGYRWSSAAENIAAGQKDPAAVMKSWMNSAGHKANILNCGYKNLGVGLAYSGKKMPYWTQDFGSLA